MSRAWLLALGLTTGCELAVDLSRPRRVGDAAVDAAEAPDPLDDAFERAIVRELPPDEPREDRCDGVDDDGDGRVDEGWAYRVYGCTDPAGRASLCNPPGRAEGSPPFWRPHLVLAAGFDGSSGAVLWREGFVQPDNGAVFVRVMWPRGGPLTPTLNGFAQWRSLAGISPAQPAIAGSIERVGGDLMALWGFNPAACARQQRCIAQMAYLDRSRVNMSNDPGVAYIPLPVARGSGLVRVGDDALVAAVEEREGILLYRVARGQATRQLGAFAVGLSAERIGNVRGAPWGSDEVVWVFDFRGQDESPMLMAVWTDLDGGVTHGPLHVVESAALDPGMTTQVAAAGGILMVIHWVNGRGTFLTRYNRAEQTRESVPLDRTRTFQRVSWDGATWFVCDVARRGAEDNQVFASRYSARGERLAPPVAIEDGSDDDNILTDCTIASSGGRALVGVGAYSNSRRGRQRVAGFACAEGAP